MVAVETWLSPIRNWSKSEIRAFIKFLHAKENYMYPTEIHNKIISDYDKDAMSKRSVCS